MLSSRTYCNETHHLHVQQNIHATGPKTNINRENDGLQVRNLFQRRFHFQDPCCSFSWQRQASKTLLCICTFRKADAPSCESLSVYLYILIEFNVNHFPFSGSFPKQQNVVKYWITMTNIFGRQSMSRNVVNFMVPYQQTRHNDVANHWPFTWSPSWSDHIVRFLK